MAATKASRPGRGPVQGPGCRRGDRSARPRRRQVPAAARRRRCPRPAGPWRPSHPAPGQAMPRSRGRWCGGSHSRARINHSLAAAAIRCGHGATIRVAACRRWPGRLTWPGRHRQWRTSTMAKGIRPLSDSKGHEARGEDGWLPIPRRTALAHRRLARLAAADQPAAGGVRGRARPALRSSRSPSASSS